MRWLRRKLARDGASQDRTAIAKKAPTLRKISFRTVPAKGGSAIVMGPERGMASSVLFHHSCKDSGLLGYDFGGVCGWAKFRGGRVGVGRTARLRWPP